MLNPFNITHFHELLGLMKRSWMVILKVWAFDVSHIYSFSNGLNLFVRFCAGLRVRFCILFFKTKIDISVARKLRQTLLVVTSSVKASVSFLIPWCGFCVVPKPQKRVLRQTWRYLRNTMLSGYRALASFGDLADVASVNSITELTTKGVKMSCQIASPFFPLLCIFDHRSDACRWH